LRYSDHERKKKFWLENILQLDSIQELLDTCYLTRGILHML
jgi:hypothetical protein